MAMRDHDSNKCLSHLTCAGHVFGACHVFSRSGRTSNRNLEFDALRSFAILYIVGFWHLYAYVTRATSLLTYCVLGLFTFISGLLLASRNEFDSFDRILAYYKRRFFRIYPLFFAALTIFYLMRIIGTDTYIKSIFLTNMLIPEPLMTLWFITLICLFYAIAPLYLYYYSTKKAILLTGILWIVLVIIHHTTGHIDLRLPRYLVPFAFGLIVARSAVLERTIKSKYFLVLCFINILVALYYFPSKDEILHLIIADLSIISSIPFFLSLGRFLARHVPFQILEIFSYASFVMYLSHKFLFALSGKLYHSPDLFVAALYYGFIVLPTTILFSYFVQLLYDKFIYGFIGDSIWHTRKEA